MLSDNMAECLESILTTGKETNLRSLTALEKRGLVSNGRLTQKGLDTVINVRRFWYTENSHNMTGADCSLTHIIALANKKY